MRELSQDGEDLEELEQTFKLEPLQMVSARRVSFISWTPKASIQVDRTHIVLEKLRRYVYRYTPSYTLY